MKNTLYFTTGFTIIELIIVVTIFSVLAIIAIPNYQKYMADNQASKLALELTTSLRLAKSEALRTNANVKVCALSSAGGTTCNDTASNWIYGWQVINTATSKILRTFQPSSAKAITINPASSIIFLPSGFPSPQTFAFTIKPAGCSRGFIINYSSVNSGQLFQTQTTTCP